MKKRILVVDDEKNLRILYEEELKSEGYDVEVADSAESAFKWLDKKEYDVIVLDIQMPGMSGLEAMGTFSIRIESKPSSSTRLIRNLRTISSLGPQTLMS